jgi:predicted component of type VI protein secretion system
MSQRPEDSDGNTRSATEVHRRPADRTIRIDEWSLAIIEGPGSGRSFRLPPGELTAGHSPENDIVLADRSVSRRHFTIQDSPEGHVVRDLGSKNGTLLDGVRVHEAYILAGGIITAGDTKLRLEAASQSFPVAPSASSHFGSIIGESPAMREMFTTLAKIAPTSLNVLMLGETGVGKEVVAQAIHEASPRRGGPLVAPPRSRRSSAPLFSASGAGRSPAPPRTAKGRSSRRPAAPSSSTSWANCRWTSSPVSYACSRSARYRPSAPTPR